MTGVNLNQEVDLNIAFVNKKLEKLYTQGKGARKYPPQVVKAFVQVVSLIETVGNESELYAFKGLHVQALSGNRKGEFSIRLNRQFRLIYNIQKDSSGTVIIILDVEDYHYQEGVCPRNLFPLDPCIQEGYWQGSLKRGVLT